MKISMEAMSSAAVKNAKGSVLYIRHRIMPSTANPRTNTDIILIG